MSSLAYSNYESFSTDERKSKPVRNKTYKKRSKPSKKAEQFLNSMPSQSGGTDTKRDQIEVSGPDTDTMSITGSPHMVGSPSFASARAMTGAEGFESFPEDFTPINGTQNIEQFGLLREGLEQQKDYHAKQNQYYNQYVPSYTGTPQDIPYYSQLLNSNDLQRSAPDELMKKLNYVVHLLEEQHDEKTGSVTEELVLYMFLGVFVIFVVDSFARSGKYKR